MKVIKTTQLLEVDVFYTLGEKALVVDLTLTNGGLKSEESAISFQTFTDDSTLMVLLTSYNGDYTVSLIAESPLEMLALSWHRLIEFTDDNNAKVVFTSISDLCNITEEERCKVKTRELDNVINRYAAKPLKETT